MNGRKIYHIYNILKTCYLSISTSKKKKNVMFAREVHVSNLRQHIHLGNPTAMFVFVKVYDMK